MGNKIDKSALCETACRELLSYGLWDTKTKLKRGVKKYVLRRQVTPEDLIFWHTGLLAAGLWQCREEDARTKQGLDATGKSALTAQIEDALRAYYDRWYRKDMPVVFLDDLLAGETLLSMYAQAQKESTGNSMPDADSVSGGKAAESENGIFDEKFTPGQCKTAVDKLADFALRYPLDETGSFPYRAHQQNDYVFVDGIGLACPFLYRYGEVFAEPECRELAVKQITNYLDYGMDNGSGLPYHGYSRKEGCKHGIIGWGRAAGWLLRGMTGCMQGAYGREKLEPAYKKLVDAVFACQRKDGYFSWQLQALEGPADTSATAMICASVKEGIALGVLPETPYAEKLESGKAALAKSVKDGKVWDCSGECEGFAQYPQRYGAYPWALGPALLLAE